MDLPACSTRAPELALIDELAHTNAPGAEHRKRYEDIADVLDAGIDVFSTVNVQHLESLNDQVAELTGVRVRETFPDSVLSAADEVVLVDVTPEALIERLRAGKVYKPERVEAALNGFFRVENLEALREVALRQVAEDVEAKRLVELPPPVRDERPRDRARRCRRRSASGCSRSSRRRPSSQRVVRRAWRSAQRLGAGSTSSRCSRPAASRASTRREQLEALRRLGSLLGAQVLIEEGDDVAEVVARVAARARQHLRADGLPGGRAAGSSASRSRSPSGCCGGCPASTCASSPIARSGKAGRDERLGCRRPVARARDRRHARALRAGAGAGRRTSRARLARRSSSRSSAAS